MPVIKAKDLPHFEGKELLLKCAEIGKEVCENISPRDKLIIGLCSVVSNLQETIQDLEYDVEGLNNKDQ